MNELVEFMGYNGPNPNKQVGGALVSLLMLHVLVIVSTGSDMWWEHGGEVCPLNSMVVLGLLLEGIRPELSLFTLKTGVNVQVGTFKDQQNVKSPLT